ncbi:AraC family transcriptional regulator [Plantactinospora sonchi]|uniref:AraC family transcriptional regulator n=1 Tax=Plantactinospora sonchi TaxID=1544735 RepID=A0ABU7RM57_9ACTN
MADVAGPSPEHREAHDARMWWAGDLGGVELFRATLTEFDFRPHAHEEFFLALTEGGVATPRYRGDSHVIGPGDLIALNPEEVHSGGPPADESWTYRAVYPGPELVRGIVAEFPGVLPPVPEFGGDVVRDPEVAAHLRRFHQLSELPGSSPLERESRLARTLVLLVSRYAVGTWSPRPPGRERQAVAVSTEYLREHAAENVSLRTLARVAGLSPYHLCRVFRQAVGVTPHAYQAQVRVWRARSLLRAGLPIAEVATVSGFYDQSHLTRHFKRILGLTPGRYVRDTDT